MGFIQRELDRIGSALRHTQPSNRYNELYAAQQALEWSLDPTSCASPLEMIEGHPCKQPISMISEKEDCLSS